MTSKPTKPNRKRRWLQYSLRTLFVLVTVGCVVFSWLGWLALRAREEEKKAQAIQKMGGTAYRSGFLGTVHAAQFDNTVSD